MKNKKFLVLTALILCLSILFIACGEEKPEEPPAPTLADIFNMDWTRPAPDTALISNYQTIDLPEGVNLASASKYENLLVYKAPYNPNITYVYDYTNGQTILTATDSYSENNNYQLLDQNNEPYFVIATNYMKNHLYVAPNADFIIILTETYTAEGIYNTYDSNSVSVDNFGSIHDYRQDQNGMKNTTYAISVYNVADTSAPILTVASNTIKSWIKNNGFASEFKAVVMDNLPVTDPKIDNKIAEDLFVQDGKIYRFDSEDNVTFVRDAGLTNTDATFTKANT